MVVFEIRNKEEKGNLLGYLFYYERSKRFFSELLKETDEWTAPFMFSGHVKRGVYSIDSVWSAKFVGQRIIPPDRQNLGSILDKNGLKEYDEFKLLQLSEGRCAQDELYLVRIHEKDINPEIKNRLNEKILDVMPLKDNKVIVFYKNGESRTADIKKICGEDRLFGKILSDGDVFKNVRVSPGGNGIEWGEERFISAETLKAHGKRSDICYGDLLGFIRERLVDTAETAGMLNCSRQYIKQLSDKQKLTPVREGANSNIFMKSSIEAE